MHDNFGMESRYTKIGAVYTINRHTIKRLRAHLNSKISVNQVTTVTAVTAGDEGGTPNIHDFEREIDIDSTISERELGLKIQYG